MDLSSVETIKFLFKKYGLKPSRERGQNFLIDRVVLDKISETAALGKGDKVLEIGPGFGVLTAELSRKAGRVVAVESDKKLAAALHETAARLDNVNIVEGDILKFQVSSFGFQKYGYKIVANLPYQITSAIFKKFLNDGPRPAEMVVMVQKEVAERICGKSGDMSLLSLSVQFFGFPEIIAIVPRGSFWPEPEVDSTILKISRIEKITEKNMNSVDAGKFFKIAKIGFSARRKQLHNNLAGGLRMKSSQIQEVFGKLGFNPKIRAQDLALNDWIKLAVVLNTRFT
jgi:16S rRNA (adenine1518-N6/adenine1519-N6)-dimethyltransferase